MTLAQSRQTALEYAEIRNTYDLKKDSAVEDFAALKDDISNIFNLLNNQSQPLFGLGSPEGVIESNNSLIYFDTTNESTTGLIQYANKNINEKTNWFLVI